MIVSCLSTKSGAQSLSCKLLNIKYYQQESDTSEYPVRVDVNFELNPPASNNTEIIIKFPDGVTARSKNFTRHKNGLCTYSYKTKINRIDIFTVSFKDVDYIKSNFVTIKSTATKLNINKY